MNKESSVAKLIAKIKKVKHIEIIIAVVAVVVMLLLYFSTKLVSAPENKTTGDLNYYETVEKNLTEILSRVRDAGEVRVIINWDSDIFSTDDKNGNSSWLGGSDSSEKPVSSPKPIGVIIICQGGSNVKVKIEITNAVSIFLGITSDKITVLTMKSK